MHETERDLNNALYRETHTPGQKAKLNENIADRNNEKTSIQWFVKSTSTSEVYIAVK